MANEAGNRPTILLVDDDTTMSEVSAKFFQSNGFDTCVAHTGEDGLRRAAAEPVSAAVVDIHLPDMTGLELAQRLRARFGDSLPIIVCSGDGSMGVLNALSSSGASYYFHKPVNRHLLLQRVNELLGCGFKTG